MKCIIIDMDGVIFDSERAVYNIWRELSEKYGFAEDLYEVYIKCIGVNSNSTRKIFTEHYGNEFPYDEYQKESSLMYRSRYDGGKLPLKPDIEDVLKGIRDKGYKIAIASSTRTQRVRMQIEEAGLISYFDDIVGGDMVTRSKPAPDIFLEAAKRLSAVPEETYVVEDSFNGIRAAYEGGFIPIMVPDMLPPDDEMKDKARYVFSSLCEVLSVL